MGLALVRRFVVAAGIAMVLVPASTASAQIGSGISGVVRDPSGGVLPGAAVEVASAVLIEGSRSTVTASNGQYQVIDLRPGDYTETFTLAGFKTARREGIRLTAAFTDHRERRSASRPARGVHHRQRRITIGRRPRIGFAVRHEPGDARHHSDRQGSVRRRSADPRRHDEHPDVGGTDHAAAHLQVHGSSNNDNVFMVDNVQIQHIGFGGNQTGFYFNDGLMEEISYQTSSLPAEAPVGACRSTYDPARTAGTRSAAQCSPAAATRASRATTWTTTSSSWD